MGYSGLIVDDEPEWQRKTTQLIPKELVSELIIAGSPADAASALRRRRFDIVILDLSMDRSNHADRSNQGIQKYLSTAPEHTQYVVFSSFAAREDARDALENYGAAAVVFKDEILRQDDKLATTIDTVLGRLPRNLPAKRVSEASRALIGDPFNEDKLLRTLPLRGAQNLYKFGERLMRDIAPITQHRTRGVLEPTADGALGLFWSRGLGYPLAVSIASASVPEQQLSERLEAWLGFEPGEVHDDFTFGEVRVRVCRLDPGMESTFALPVIPV